MLTENATLFERLRDLVPSTAPASPPAGDVERLLALGVPRVQDLRQNERPDSLARGRSRGRRAVAAITALCLHQTATDALTPGHPRLAGIPAHALVHQDGVVTLLHDMESLVWHGHALNRFSIGIELVCREPGIAGIERTFWRSDREKLAGKTMADLISPLTDAQAKAAIALGTWYREEVIRRAGVPTIRFAVAHRQGHKSRTSDPGSRAWELVAAPLYRDGVLFEDASLRTWGSGRPLPDAWTGQKNGVAYA